MNRYGLFATMTTDRKEIIVLGSLDNKHWKPYTFKYKAHSEFDRPKWASPHQARLDWQLWFLALRPYSERSWANALMQRLLEKDPHVEALFESVPFENGPKFIKLVSRKARFSSYSELSHSKKWWLFGPERAYSPSFVLNRF